MLLDIVKAFIIGICASIPLGPIAILIIQKSIVHGRRMGFVTGLGTTTVESICAITAVYALTVTETFIERYRVEIMIAGGIIVAIIGISMMLSNPFKKKLRTKQKKSDIISNYFQAFVTAISNPGAFLLMFALFASFNVNAPKDLGVIPIILAVATGSALYWFNMSWLFSKLGKKIKISTILWINRISGVIICGIGVVFSIKGLVEIFLFL